MRDTGENFFDSIAAHVRNVYTVNAEARSEISERIASTKLALNRHYDPSMLNAIRSRVGGSESYYPLIAMKSAAAAAWLRKILDSGDRCWTITQTPDPDLPEHFISDIAMAAVQEAQRIKSLGMVMTDADAAAFGRDMRNLIMQSRNQRAADAAANAERLIDDVLTEANFQTVFADFIEDFVAYPAAFIRSVIRNEKISRVDQLQNDGNGENFQLTIEEQPCRRFERVPPHLVFPSPGQISPEDGDLIIVSLFSIAELSELARTPGYNRDAINSIISEMAATTGSDHDPLDCFPEAQLFNSAQYRRSSCVACLEYWGAVRAAVIRDWLEAYSSRDDGDDDSDGQPEFTGDAISIPGADDGENFTGNGTFNVYAIVARDKCIHLQIMDENEERWIFSASYQRDPDSIWGQGLGDRLRDLQRDCNGLHRTVINNLHLASLPQMVVNTDAVRVPPGRLNRAAPGQVWSVSNVGFIGSHRPIDFITVPDNSAHVSQQFERLLVLADRLSVPEYSQGIAQGAINGAAGTASGLAMLIEAAGNQVMDAIRSIDHGVIEPVVRALYREMLNDPEVPNDAKGDFKIHALGANSLAFKTQLQQRRNEFFQLVLQSQVLQSLLKPEGVAALAREVVKTLDMPTEKIVPPDSEVLAWANAQRMAADSVSQQEVTNENPV